MTFDIDEQRTSDEKSIATAVTAELVAHLHDPDIQQPETVAHHFGTACRTLGIAPENEAAVIRIMEMVHKNLGVMREIADTMAAAMVQP